MKTHYSLISLFHYIYYVSFTLFINDLGNYTGKLIVDGCLILDIGEIKYTKDPFLDNFDGENAIKKHQIGPIIITVRLFHYLDNAILYSVHYVSSTFAFKS